MNYTSPEFIKSVFEKKKTEIFIKFNVKPEHKPIAYILGGQPAAGKSNLITHIQDDYPDRNFLVINGDDYRIHHPEHEKIAKDVINYSTITQPYSNIFTEGLINEAVKNKYNVIIEGTMRNPETPLRTTELLFNGGFETHAAILIAHPKISELNVYIRYQKEVENKGYGRLADINSHNEACEKIPYSVDCLYRTRAVDFIHLFSTNPIQKYITFDRQNGEWNDKTKPSVYIERGRMEQIKNPQILTDKIKAGNDLLKSISPELKPLINSIIKDLNIYQNKISPESKFLLL